MFRILLSSLLSLVLASMAWRYCRPAPGTEAPDGRILEQLAYLEWSADHGGPARMQALFPEGAFFCHTLRSLAWTQVAARSPSDGESFKAALASARRGLDSMEAQLKAFPYTRELRPAYGAFFSGWINWTRGAILSLRPQDPADSSLREDFLAACDTLAETLAGSPTPYLESYADMAWPSDNVVGVAALRMRDFLYGEKYAGLEADWIRQVGDRLDPVTGMIPYRVDPLSGRPMEGAHGNSQAVILTFLAEIDPGFAASQYRAYLAAFRARPLWLWLAREHPLGQSGAGNIDSGPVLFGAGSAATMVALAPLRMFGDHATAHAVRVSIDALGFPFTYGGKRRYAFGAMPVADAFLAWAETAAPYSRDLPAAAGTVPGKAWRIPFLAVLAILAASAWIVPGLLFKGKRKVEVR